MKKTLSTFVVVVILSFAVMFTGCNKPKNELYVYNWSEYMPEAVVEQFEKETGIKVMYSTYDSNEMMYSKIKLQKGEGYDIIVPSTYYVDKMGKEGLLLEMDHSKIPNIKNYFPHLMNQPYDAGNKFSIPYMWGPSLIAYNSKYIPKGSITSWNDLWNPDFKGYVLLNNDVREVFQMALMKLGYSGNSTKEEEIKAAYEELVKLLPSVRTFNSDSPKLPFLNEEVRIGLVWGGEIYRAQNINKDIQYAYPKEGAIVWMDCLSIPKGAKNADNAYKFIDFISRPDISVKIVEAVGYSTPNQKALELMPAELRDNRVINPIAEDLKNSEFQENIGDAILIYEKYWEKLKTQ